MPNLTAQLEAAVQATWPGATVVERLERSLRHQIAPNRFALDCTIGPIHYLNSGSWTSINTDFANSDLPGYSDMVVAAPLRLHSDSNGGRRIYPRRDVLTEYIELSRLQFWSGTQWRNLNLPARTRSADALTWDANNFTLRILHRGSQVKAEAILKSASAAPRIRWPVTLVGLTYSTGLLISQSTGQPVARLHRPTITRDGTGKIVPRPVLMSYTDGALEFNPDLSGLTYPITIDPTVDTQVSAADRDAKEDDNNANFGSTFLYVAAQTANYNRYNCGFLFTVTGPASGDTVNALTFELRTNLGGGRADDAALDIYCNDVDSAADFTTDADVTSRVKTTASVSWAADGVGGGVDQTWVTSPGFATVGQEILDRPGWSSGSNMMVLLWGKTQAAYKILGIDAYEDAAADAAKLHIEYTAGGSTISAPPIGAQVI